jgi:predicted MFS family arabinose efflux permease
MTTTADLPAGRRLAPGLAARLRGLIIALTAFLTLVDLFATQAILPSLAQAYGVGPAAMGLAVNASTLGMAVAGLAVALFGRRIDQRRGLVLSLALLAIPTALLAAAPDLATFAALRIAQGVFMVSAFTLMLAYLGEECSAAEAAGAFAAYIAGNVASNLVGRLLSAAVADHFGLASNFLFFAGLNLAGAVLVFLTIHPSLRMAPGTGASGGAFAAWRRHLADPALAAGFAIGFCILFAFIGTFTFVNFVLVAPPFGLPMMTLGLVYLVFLPSLFTTVMTGRAVRRFGVRRTVAGALALAGLGLPPMLSGFLPLFLAGLALVAVGTFAAQAAVTGFVGRAASADRSAASGMYLASYFLGGLVGTAVLGRVFDAWGWTPCLAGIALALAAAILLTPALRLPASEDRH